MLGIRCSRPRSEAERAQASRPQAGTSGAKWRALSAAKGEREEDNTGIFQIDYGYNVSDFPDLPLTFSRSATTLKFYF